MAAKTEYKPSMDAGKAQEGLHTVYKMESTPVNTSPQSAQQPVQPLPGISGNPIQSNSPGNPEGQSPSHFGQNDDPNGDNMSNMPELGVPGEQVLSNMGGGHTIGRIQERAENKPSSALGEPRQGQAVGAQDQANSQLNSPAPKMGFQLSMAVDPADASQYSPSRQQDPARSSPSQARDLDEGDRAINRIVDHNPLQMGIPVHAAAPLVDQGGVQFAEAAGHQESYSLIRDGDSIVEKGKRVGVIHQTPMSTYGHVGIHPGTGGQANKRAAQTVNATGEYQIKGNKGLFSTNEQPDQQASFTPYPSQTPPLPATVHEPNGVKAVSHDSGDAQKSVVGNQGSVFKGATPQQQSSYKVEQTSSPSSPHEAKSVTAPTQGTSQPLSADQLPLQVHDPASQMASPRSQEENNPNNDSNIANLSDSLHDAKSSGPSPNKPTPHEEEDLAGKKAADSGSKFQNDFGKYVKDEAGMSIFAPPDIDYQNRADKAEAHLLKYNTEVRGKLEIVLRGLQQIYSNIQKINLSSQESTGRFRTFFAAFLKKAETVASDYHYKKGLKLLEEKKEMLELRTPGNLKTLAGIFENMKTHRETWIDDIVKDIGRLKDSYQSKVVEENFFEEGIDKKSTVEMSKLIEKSFESALKRNKECLKEFDDINRKLEENKIYFEKNKKFKQDAFEGYIDYLRSVHKMWGFLSEAQERMVKYWERVKKMETMRIKAISGLLMDYINIEERLTTPSRALDSLRKLNQAMSPENMAASAYNDKSFLNSAIFESLGFNMDSIEQFTQEIKRLKTRTPEIVEFALWDYMNTSMLVKNESKPIRIFRSNENYLYIYETNSREDVIMGKPLYKCKVNNLILQFDNRNNFITLKSTGMFDFSSFSFNLREHQDAQDLVNYVVKFASNGQDLLKAGIASNPQK